MDIIQEKVDSLNAVVKIKLTEQDYQGKVNEAVKKVQRQASMPGFRPGKVPVGLIKKMYGKSVLVEELNKILNDSIYKYIQENKIEILGNPLPRNTETEIDWDNQKEFEFNYDLGLAPQFEVEVSDKISFDYEVVKVDDELVEKYLKDVKRNYGKPSSPETAGDTDVLYVDINQLEEDGSITPGGIFKSTSISLDRVKNDSAKARFAGATIEDKIIIHCNELYASPVELSIGLGIEKEAAEVLNCNLQVSIRNISRMEDAELNQELFDRIYGEGKVNGIEEFKNKIKEELAVMFTQDQDRKLFGEIERALVEKYNPNLPEDFLKRWLMTVNEKPITLEQVNSDFDNYAAAMKWKLIENKIIKQHQITVNVDEAREEAGKFIRAQYARYGQTPSEEEVNKIASSILAKEQEAQKIMENLYNAKLLQLFKTNFSLNNKEVGYNEFFGIKE